MQSGIEYDGINSDLKFSSISINLKSDFTFGLGNLLCTDSYVFEIETG